LIAGARAQLLLEQVTQQLPPHTSQLPEVIVTTVGGVEQVTINVPWQSRGSQGAVVLTREFYL